MFVSNSKTCFKKHICNLMMITFIISIPCLLSCSDDDDNMSDKTETGDIESQYYIKNQKELALIGEEATGFDGSAYNRNTLSESERSALDGLNTFSIELFKQLESDEFNKGENLLVSPFSAQQVLALIANGANEQTLDEIYKVLGYDGSQENYNSANRMLLNLLKSDDEECAMEIANAAWIDHTKPVFRAFRSNLKNYYDSDIMGVDINADDAGKIINSWCSDKTHGMIDKIIDDGPMSSRLVLANAVYFKASWSDCFDKKLTSKETFYNSNGKAPKVDMMRWSQPLYANYASLEKMDVVCIPFVDKYSMMVCLPKSKSGLGLCVESLNDGEWRRINEKLTKSLIDIRLPKFKSSADMDLVEIMKVMGIKKLFTESGCLSRLSTIPLMADEFRQKSVIDVDEDGTEAAAVTYIGEKSTGVPSYEEKAVELRIDHPFVYCIFDSSTGTILFMGSVKNL